MKKTVIVATGNDGKIREIQRILEDVDAQLLKLKDAGIFGDVVEDGDTFEANARLKAGGYRALALEKGYEDALIIAEDSGLEVDCLGGEPGVYSARYLGEDTSYDIKNGIIIDRTDKAGTDRVCRYRCVVAMACSEGCFVTEGSVEGTVAYEQKGDGGFGYDPMFYLEEYGCTMAELPSDIKNNISHRARAFGAMKKLLLEKGIWTLKQ